MSQDDGPPRAKKQKAATVIPKTALDVQRIQLEKLMEDPVSIQTSNSVSP